MDSLTYLVSGANSEIGAEVCRYALKKGHSVIALYNRNNARLELLRKEYKNIDVFKLNFMDTENVEDFIDNNKKLLDLVDVFIGLAAIRKSIAYGEIRGADLIEHFKVNVIPQVLLIQYLGRVMERKSWGRIIVGSSIGVKFGGGDDSYCYSLTKKTCEIIPKIAKQWAASGVLTNIVRIGVTDTAAFNSIGKDDVKKRIDLVPMKRLASPYEIAKSIYFLASSDNTFITGQIIPISGGE